MMRLALALSSSVNSFEMFSKGRAVWEAPQGYAVEKLLKGAFKQEIAMFGTRSFYSV